jgi:hypothetical protein
MSAVLLLAGWLLRRATFVAQSLAALALTLVHAAVVDLFIAPAQTAFTATRVFVVGAMWAVLLLTLPIAFAVRRRFADSAADDWVDLVLSRPEQPFFFAPLLLLVALLVLQLHGGMITVGWSALGVAAFLFALTVSERSYRLAGLSVLMLGAGRILVIDIWNASTSDRWFTLIAMGAALLLISFLDSRYRETLLKLL